MLNLPQTPKWDIARVSHSTLVNADCFDVFPFIEEKSIDVIICDLPYGTTQNKWDSILPLDKLWNEYKRILKPDGIVCLFGDLGFKARLILSNEQMFKYDLIWDKVVPSGFLNANKMPMRRHESIMVFGGSKFNKIMKPRNPNSHSLGKVENYTKSRGKVEQSNYGEISDKKINAIEDYSIKNPDTILEFTKGNGRGKYKREHPTQKPIDLMEWLVKTYTNENDMVLDNTMGSGTTNLACLKLNRKSIGIEKEKQYYDVAVRRLSSYCG
jgi:site-specific DNA-methyltransferase (adenine-specific)